MRASWKPTHYLSFSFTPSTGVSWSALEGRSLLLYTGRRWKLHRVRDYYLLHSVKSFIKSRPVGRPVRDKFRNVRNSRKRK